MVEEWREVPGFEGKYEISSFGRLKRIESNRHVGNGNTAILRERISTGFVSDHGYRRTTLGSNHKRYIHQLVCEAFHGPCPEGKNQVAHYDGNKQNNRFDNLRWVDWQDNRDDAKRLGEVRRGTSHPRATLTESDVRDIRARHNSGESMRNIARVYRTCHQHIGDVVRRRIWKSVE